MLIFKTIFALSLRKINIKYKFKFKLIKKTLTKPQSKRFKIKNIICTVVRYQEYKVGTDWYWPPKS